ncbi:hypothetical protein [Manganibacter manganicus]|uniref:Major tail protein n=1 Tax=Manganibacter manganicus TaxID=1873176 RepID=A0A1V8RQZ2_9HYPH|nr:hypothetical protein [Pseudaminobacter manganicus]OQM75597.1 hypothetical protein BFN67_17650 [Pseudaminobacter manganicus]
MDFQSEHLTIPRGKIFFAKYNPGTQVPGAYRELGNCPEFTLTRDSETIQHFSSQAGLKVLDEEINIGATMSGALTTDDIKSENVAYFFMGGVSTIAATAQTDVSETFETVKAGDVYQLGQSDTVPSGVRSVTITTVTDGATTPVALVENTDYEVDLDLGLLTALKDQLKIVVTYDVAASTREQIVAGDTQVEGALKFVSFNALGEQADYTMPRARLSANGDFALVNDPDSTAFQTMPLSLAILKKGNLALAYRDGRAVAA